MVHLVDYVFPFRRPPAGETSNWKSWNHQSIIMKSWNHQSSIKICSSSELFSLSSLQSSLETIQSYRILDNNVLWYNLTTLDKTTKTMTSIYLSTMTTAIITTTNVGASAATKTIKSASSKVGTSDTTQFIIASTSTNEFQSDTLQL